MEFEGAFARRLRIDWDGAIANIIGRDDLILAKRAAGREKDLRDLRAIEKSTKRI